MARKTNLLSHRVDAQKSGGSPLRRLQTSWQHGQKKVKATIKVHKK